jgi:ferredoxin
MKYLPQVDEGICAAHGDCVEIAPTVFALNDVAHVIGDGAPETILEAAEACPSAAISVIDEDTGEQVYP